MSTGMKLLFFINKKTYQFVLDFINKWQRKKSKSFRVNMYISNPNEIQMKYKKTIFSEKNRTSSKLPRQPFSKNTHSSKATLDA